MNSRLARLALVIAVALIPASAMGMASAELYSTKAYYYGRFDARIQFAPGDGVVSSFFLWKEGSDAANAYWNELDYEKVGSDCHMQINNIYGSPKTQHQQTPALASICSAYHDYRFEWTPTYIAWVVDGKEIRRDTGASATAYAQNASAGMSFHFNIWPGNSSFGGNINNTTLPVHQYISWVEYASYDNGNFTVQWHEDFQSPSTPSGWAVGTWGSPFSLSTHNPQNVGFVNGIAVMSLSADNATGIPGTPPVDTSAGGAGAGGSSGAGGITATGGNGAGGLAAAGGAAVSGSGGSTALGGNGAGGLTTSGGAPASSSGGSAARGGNNAGGAMASGGTSASGGMSGAGSTATSGGATGSGGRLDVGSGGTTGSSVPPASGGATSSGTPTTGGASGGESPGRQAGCSCSTTTPARPLGPALLVLLFVTSIYRLRRKEF
jgi:hypothetical protein